MAPAYGSFECLEFHPEYFSNNDSVITKNYPTQDSKAFSCWKVYFRKIAEVIRYTPGFLL